MTNTLDVTVREGTQFRGLIDNDLDQLQYEINQLRERFSNRFRGHMSRSNNNSTFYPIVREILQTRRHREALFGSQLFGEPAWDILLELWVAQHENRGISVSGVCYASAAPLTTGLRWIERLEQGGWIAREADARDSRRWWVFLSESGSCGMKTLLSGLAATHEMRSFSRK